MPTLDALFVRIAGKNGAIDRPHMERFLQDAGVGSGFLGGTKVSIACDAFFDKFAGGRNQLTWDAFVQRGHQLLPPGIAAKADLATVDREIDKLYAQLDKDGRGITMNALTAHLTALAETKGGMMAGKKAEIGAKILMHALDDSGDNRLQKDELKSFAHDVIQRVGDK